MELRVLEYFLAVAKAESISGAAKNLHLSQPTLSRQLHDMEEELGKKLFIRGNRRITLTEEGMLLRKRAEEITDLVQKTQSEISTSDDITAGDIHIGAGESEGIRMFMKAAKQLRDEYPDIHFHILSGDKTTILESLDKGLLDFGIVFDDVNYSKYDGLELKAKEKFGVLMRKDDILADKKEICYKDLYKKPLIVSRQIFKAHSLHKFFKCKETGLNIIASYSLLFNGSLMVEEGMGYAICFDKIINTVGSQLCFRPLESPINYKMSIIWKKDQVMSKSAKKYLEKVQQIHCGQFLQI